MMERMHAMAQRLTVTPAPLQSLTDCVQRLAQHGLRGRSDRELLDRFRHERDEAAFAELVRRHGPMVLAACRRVLRHHHDAEDVFQAAFLVLARKAGSIRRDSVAGWLHQVAFRLAVRARTLGCRRRLAPLAEPDALAEPAPHERLAAALDTELERLPEHCRAVVVLCYLEGLTQSAAARQLATTPDAVNSRLKRARELLRRRLIQQGIAPAAALTLLGSSAATAAALSGMLAARTVRAALSFASHASSACAASEFSLTLAKGALFTMSFSKIKTLALMAAATALLVATIVLNWTQARAEQALAGAAAGQGKSPPARAAAPNPKDVGKKPRSLIFLWMSGGPSQFETFDPKPGAFFDAIGTSVKGLQISQTLPRLAKQAQHLAILRGVSHREGDHARAGRLMRTGYPIDGTNYPSIAALVGKELGRAEQLRFVSIAPLQHERVGAGFLGPQYGPIEVAAQEGDGPVSFVLPDAGAFEALAKGRGEAHRKLVEKALDVTQENANLIASYGPTKFGQGCLVARRLVEQGVAVVEVTLPGWDMHQNIPGHMPLVAGALDAGLATLILDLHDKKLLDSTLVVCLGEFGRTPRINASAGRDHWPLSLSVVLAGAGIKGGQAIGKTNRDGTAIDERPVRPAELMATICAALGVDPAKTNVDANQRRVRIVEKGAEAVKEALR
jgi:RNA polymerase sigma factor (sigma-70 family)